jgi:hypothetical protein
MGVFLNSEEALDKVKPYWSNDKWHTIACSVLQGPASSSDQHIILQGFTLFSLSFCHLVATSELWRLAIFRKINLDQTIEIHKWHMQPKPGPCTNMLDHNKTLLLHLTDNCCLNHNRYCHSSN